MTSPVLSALVHARDAGLITDLDLHFSGFIARLAGTESPPAVLAVVLGACLASQWTSNGHVCVSLPEVAGRRLFELPDAEPLFAPRLDDWVAALRASPMVGKPGEYRPLILDEHGHLYLFRYWDYERRLAQDLLRRAALSADDVDFPRLKRDLAELFPPEGGGRVNEQKVAAATAVLRRFCVISGGPGTGKTTTVVRLLALLIQQAAPRALAIGLAAPTGKAAARLQQAIRQGKQQLRLPPTVSAAIPDETSTLHRLLGASPGSVYLRYHREHPLPLDVLVVDEASMVDLALMAKLVQALPERARLILLGDKGQLASVEPGAVLGDLCAGATGYSPAFRQQLVEVTDEPIPSGAREAGALADSIAFLEKSYRFGPRSGIGEFARRVNRGEGQGVLDLLGGGGFPDLLWQRLDASAALPRALVRRAAQGFAPYLRGVRAGLIPEQAFAAFNRFQVLSAHRAGPTGVEGLNLAIEAELRHRGLIRSRQLWYPGRPVMVSCNDYGLRLFNGDLGITLADPEDNGRLRVYFQATDGALRSFPPGRLPAHETVYAMTVHKSQGSEFDHMLLVLSPEASSLTTRTLLYTAITRARQCVELWAHPDVLAQSVTRHPKRSSGLQELLWGYKLRGCVQS
jgi:exodeoxyribonuclease V alpha subunit